MSRRASHTKYPQTVWYSFLHLAQPSQNSGLSLCEVGIGTTAVHSVGRCAITFYCYVIVITI